MQKSSVSCDTPPHETVDGEHAINLKDEYAFLESVLYKMSANTYKEGKIPDAHRFTASEMNTYAGYFEKVIGLLHHDKDKKLYQSLIEHRTGKHTARFLAYRSSPHTQYVDFLNTEKIRTIIDGGIGDGAELLRFLTFSDDVIVYGFEPCYEAWPKNSFHTLTDSHNVTIFPSALWRSSGNVTLITNSENSEHSQVAGGAHAGDIVPSISIDDFVNEKGIRVDFIKLDVEGAELDVLNGAEETITKHKPQIAISVYHKKEHLFEIPLLLHALVDDYAYRLGHYSLGIAETILYAVR